MMMALRTACVREEPSLFNDFGNGGSWSFKFRLLKRSHGFFIMNTAQHILAGILAHRAMRAPFLEEMAAAGIRLITSEESPLSYVTEAAAGAFRAAVQGAPAAEAAAPHIELRDEAEDLLNEL